MKAFIHPNRGKTPSWQVTCCTTSPLLYHHPYIPRLSVTHFEPHTHHLPLLFFYWSPKSILYVISAAYQPFFICLPSSYHTCIFFLTSHSTLFWFSSARQQIASGTFQPYTHHVNLALGQQGAGEQLVGVTGVGEPCDCCLELLWGPQLGGKERRNRDLQYIWGWTQNSLYCINCCGQNDKTWTLHFIVCLHPLEVFFVGKPLEQPLKVLDEVGQWASSQLK